MKDNKIKYIIPRIHNLRDVWFIQWTSCSANAIATTNIAKSNNKLVPPLCIRFVVLLCAT